MTKDESCEKKGIFLLYALITIYYTIPSFLYCLFNTLNPLPLSCRESLESLANPNFLALDTQFAKIRYTSQSLITRYPKAFFKEKYKGDRAFCGEGKVLPRLMRRGFERDRTTLPLASEIGAEIPLKACCGEGLEGIIQIGWWREKSPKNAVWMKV